MGQGEAMKKTSNVQRPTSNGQKFRLSAFDVGRWALGVRRFLPQ
jgi:hypothetical protein